MTSKNETLAEPTTDAAAPAEKTKTIGVAIAELVMDATMSYDQIVKLIHEQFKPCNTSARSVASVAARLRKDGMDVPHRRKAKPRTE